MYKELEIISLKKQMETEILGKLGQRRSLVVLHHGADGQEILNEAFPGLSSRPLLTKASPG